MAIGEFVGQGLAKGLEGMKRTVERASDTLVGYAIPDVVDVGIGYQISRVNRQAQSKINQHVTSSVRSEEHTSELQSRGHLVCRLLLEKKNFDIVNQHPLEKITKDRFTRKVRSTC